jgi:hypothetical protein
VSAHDWQKSSYSSQGANCLYVAARSPDVIKLRESDTPDVILITTPAGLHTFITAAKAGAFNHLPTYR